VSRGYRFSRSRRRPCLTVTLKGTETPVNAFKSGAFVQPARGDIHAVDYQTVVATSFNMLNTNKATHGLILKLDKEDARTQWPQTPSAELVTGRVHPRVGSGWVGSGWVGSGRVGSGRVGSGRVGSGRVGSGRVGSGRVGSGRVGSGRVGS
jgi:hypothetical protein